jgi:hypothetical protein
MSTFGGVTTGMQTVIGVPIHAFQERETPC